MVADEVCIPLKASGVCFALQMAQQFFCYDYSAVQHLCSAWQKYKHLRRRVDGEINAFNPSKPPLFITLELYAPFNPFLQASEHLRTSRTRNEGTAASSSRAAELRGRRRSSPRPRSNASPRQSVLFARLREPNTPYRPPSPHSQTRPPLGPSLTNICARCRGAGLAHASFDAAKRASASPASSKRRTRGQHRDGHHDYRTPPSTKRTHTGSDTGTTSLSREAGEKTHCARTHGKSAIVCNYFDPG